VTVVVWAATLAAAYLTDRSAQLAGWLVPAGYIFGVWFGGRTGGIRGRREWADFVVRIVGVTCLLFLLLGLGSCWYAMALYG
jgi:hypothetical protein